MSEAGPLKGAGFGIQEVTVQNPTVQNAGGADLSKFGSTTEDDSDAEDAKKREALSQMLSLLGFNDLPATRTDLMNQAGKLQALQGQIAAAIKELQESGADPAGAGNIAGPPSPESATKIAALNDLQVQLKDAAETFQNYAYSYFASQEGTEKTVTLSQGQILKAYNTGVITKQDAALKLKELKMSDGDIGILLKMEAPGPGEVRKDLRLKVQSPTVLTGGKSKGGEGEIRAEDGSYVPKSFYNKTDQRPVPSSGGSGGSSESGAGKRMTQAELDALAATLLERAKGGR